MRRRARGITLVELLVVLTLVSMIISAVATCLHSMYRADRRTRESMAARSTLDRLSLQFRADAHGAVDAEVKDQALEGTPTIAFSCPTGETIEYRFEGTRVQRIVRKDGQDVHRDAFRLPRRIRVEWQAPVEDEPLVSMVVHYVSESDIDEATRQQRIDAAVGLRNVVNQSNG